jgi:hypothetical protein
MLVKTTARRIPSVKSPSPNLRAIFISHWSKDTSKCLSDRTLSFLPSRLDFFFLSVNRIPTKSSLQINVGTGEERCLGALHANRCWAATTDFSAVPARTGLDFAVTHAAPSGEVLLQRKRQAPESRLRLPLVRKSRNGTRELIARRKEAIANGLESPYDYRRELMRRRLRQCSNCRKSVAAFFTTNGRMAKKLTRASTQIEASLQPN